MVGNHRACVCWVNSFPGKPVNLPRNIYTSQVQVRFLHWSRKCATIGGKISGSSHLADSYRGEEKEEEEEEEEKKEDEDGKRDALITLKRRCAEYIGLLREQEEKAATSRDHAWASRLMDAQVNFR